MSQAAKTDHQERFPVFSRLPKVSLGAHRGGSEIGPANTMYCYRKSVSLPVHLLEIDLHLTGDGHLVLMHDPVVSTTTDGSGFIRDMTLADLKRLDAAYWYSEDGRASFPLRGCGITVPTLDEVLDEFAESQPGLVFFFDFKAAAAVAPALRVAERRGLLDRLVLGAVMPNVNAEVMRLRPAHVPLAADAWTMLKLLLAFWTGMLRFSTIRHEILGFPITDRIHKLLSPGLMAALRQRAPWVALFGPGVNTIEGQRKWVSLGANMVVTDRPDIFRALLNEGDASLESSFSS